MKKKLPKWETVGSVTVDAGLIQLGDPCYGNLDEFEKHANWVRYLEGSGILNADENVTVIPHGHDKEGNYKHHAKAVVVSSGYGDGCYPVQVRREDGRIKEVRIRFF